MRTKVESSLERLRSSFWFIPAVMTALAVTLGIILPLVDDVRGWETGLFYGGGAEGARELLSALAGSMITVAGVVFSVTIVVLSLTTQEVGPRLLRTFIRDRANQFVLGTFLATFVYCLAVLRQIRGGEDEFVPALSVSFAVLLAVASIGVLIFFIHHVATSIQVSNVVARVANDIHAAIPKRFPSRIGAPPQEREHGRADPAEDVPPGFDRAASRIPAKKSGYVLNVDGQDLVEVASMRDLVVKLVVRPGTFVVAGDDLARAWPADRCRDDEVVDRLCRAFIVGSDRTSEQDIAFLFDQLVEISLRALSPSLNDPFTVIVCLERFRGIFASLEEHDRPSPYRYDGEGRLRVVAETLTFEDLLEHVMGPIRQHGASNSLVMAAALDTLASLAGHARTGAQRDAVVRQARLIDRAVRTSIDDDRALGELARKYRAALDAAGAPFEALAG
jgi:uncharacterized membrane protein